MTSTFKIETELVEADFYLFLTLNKSIVDFDSFVDYFDNETTTSRTDNKTFREHFGSIKDKINKYFEMMKSGEVVFAEYADGVLNVAPDYNRDRSTDYEVDVDVFTNDEAACLYCGLEDAEDEEARQEIIDLEALQLIERVEFFKQFSKIVYIPVVDSIFFYCIK